MKSIIRRDVLAKINALSSSERELHSRAVQKNLERELAAEAGTWLAYQALKDEPQINWHSAAPHIDWAFPVLNADGLEFKKSVKNFRRSTLGFAEPVDGENLELKDIAGVVVPGVAFDHRGYRLGRGAGYYDKSLNEFKNKKIGICFEVSLLAVLPNEAHDIRCEKIITEKKVYQAGSTEGELKWN